LGRGGMSEVFAATDLRLGRQVAIKFLRAEVDDPVARARIEGEARSAAALSHPNIVNVYDAGDHEDRPYVVMELADARSLADVIREEGSLSVERVRSIALQVLSALGAAHSEGFVHRDVKPANILVCDDGTVKLADFGIAKSFSDAASAMTAVGLVMGTPTYLSPEQASSQPATPRSDLYAMGVVLYESVTGTPPFTGDTPMEVVTAHAHAPVPDIRAASPDVPEWFARVTERALTKDPADRYFDAAEMARALESGGASDPTRAVSITETAALATRPLPEEAAQRAWAPAVMGVVAVVLFVLLLVLGLRGGGSGDAPPTPTTQESAAAVDEDAPPDTPLPAPPPPGSLSELLARLEDDPEAFGEKGPDLRNKLREVMAYEDESKQAEEASKLQDEVSKWSRDGELDPVMATLTIELLEPLTTAPVADKPGRGNGKPDEDKDKNDD
ncbi:MAG: serine/threonine protein kinase, partial [Actinobacteria bacterium]|nr:serine/threonine protein kinase [Actinomycetota bacterium]